MKKILSILFLPVFCFAFDLGVKVGTTQIDFQNETHYINGTADIYLNKYLFAFKRNLIGFSFDFLYGKNLSLNEERFYRSFEGNVILVFNLASDVGTPEIFILSGYVNPMRRKEGRIDGYLGGGISSNKIKINQEVYEHTAYQGFLGFRWMYIERLGMGFEYRIKNFHKKDLKSVKNYFFNITASF